MTPLLPKGPRGPGHSANQFTPFREKHQPAALSFFLAERINLTYCFCDQLTLGPAEASIGPSGLSLWVLLLKAWLAP